MTLQNSKIKLADKWFWSPRGTRVNINISSYCPPFILYLLAPFPSNFTPPLPRPSFLCIVNLFTLLIIVATEDELHFTIHKILSRRKKWDQKCFLQEITVLVSIIKLTMKTSRFTKLFPGFGFDLKNIYFISVCMRHRLQISEIARWKYLVGSFWLNIFLSIIKKHSNCAGNIDQFNLIR